MSVVIKLIGLADGRDHPDAGRYLQWWNLEAHGGRGAIRTTPDIEHAFRFPDAGAAIMAWRASPPNHLTRSTDGRPNRPLTAWTCEFLTVEDDTLRQPPPEVER